MPTEAEVGHKLSESNWRKTSSRSVSLLVFDGAWLREDEEFILSEFAIATLSCSKSNR